MFQSRKKKLTLKTLNAKNSPTKSPKLDPHEIIEQHTSPKQKNLETFRLPEFLNSGTLTQNSNGNKKQARNLVSKSVAFNEPFSSKFIAADEKITSNRGPLSKSKLNEDSQLSSI